MNAGDFTGSFFTYIEDENRGDSLALLIMPSPTQAIYVDKREIEYDLKFGNIDFVCLLPPEHYESHKAQFIYYAKKEGIYANK